MKIETNTQDIFYEVTVVAGMFFKKEDDIEISVSTFFDDGVFFSKVCVTSGKEVFFGEHSMNYDGVGAEYEYNRFQSVCTARAICVAAEKAIFPEVVSMPWGVMLGIRPAKLIREYVQRGYSYEGATKRLQQIYGVSERKAFLLSTVAQYEKEIIDMATDDLVSLYIGIPFCPTRCSYCSFISTDMRNSAKYMQDYTDLLALEIKHIGGIVDRMGKNVQSIYIGGGTPTSLSPLQLNQVLTAVCDHIPMEKLREFTVEAGRADTITFEKLAVMASYPVDRISINPQTTNQQTLDLIGRCHSVEDVYRAYEMTREKTNFSVNMDLIAGLPLETEDVFCRSVDDIVALNPENITIHTMSIKRGSRLKEDLKRVDLAHASIVNSMLNYAADKVQSIEMVPYYMYRQKHMIGNLENVGYSKMGCMSIYNVNIMEEIQSIIAAGCGGVSKIVNKQTGQISRIFNFKDPIEYINRFDEIISRKNDTLNFI